MGFMDRIKTWFKADKELASTGIPQADPDKAPDFTPQGAERADVESSPEAQTLASAAVPRADPDTAPDFSPQGAKEVEAEEESPDG
jgi:hypothetical protein